MRIRIQYFGSMQIRINRVLKTKNFKISHLKKFPFETKKCNLFKPRPPWRTFMSFKEAKGFKRERPAILNIKFLHYFFFCGSFFPHWYGSCRPKPFFGSGSTTLLKIICSPPLRIAERASPSPEQLCRWAGSRSGSWRYHPHPAQQERGLHAQTYEFCIKQCFFFF